MGGYAENSFFAIIHDLAQKRRHAQIRADRWMNNYGPVGCYPDLMAVAAFLEDIERAAMASAEHRRPKAGTPEAERFAETEAGNAEQADDVTD